MKCFTVGESQRPGIRPVQAEGHLFVVAGHGPASQGFRLAADFAEVVRETCATKGPHLVGRCSFSKAGLIVPERDRDRFDTIVKIETQPGEGGVLVFTTSMYDEEEANGRVVRRYHPFICGDDPPPGIRVLAVGVGPTGHQECLLQLAAGASFRLERTGRLGDASPVVIVRWNGHRLTATAPGRFNKR